jgi:quercetin dioxygenase-like cupin family protein
MLIRRADEVGPVPVQAGGAVGVTMRLLLGRGDGAPTFAMRHFTVEPGGCTPRHSHDYEHEVLVLGGRARIEQDGEFADLHPGDVVFVRPGTLHQFVNAGDGPLEFLCLVPVTRDCGEPTPGS